MATAKQIHKEADELIEKHGLEKAKEIMKFNIEAGRNSVTVALWEVVLSTITSRENKTK